LTGPELSQGGQTFPGSQQDSSGCSQQVQHGALGLSMKTLLEELLLPEEPLEWLERLALDSLDIVLLDEGKPLLLLDRLLALLPLELLLTLLLPLLPLE
jgi:hypothetical protein